MNIFSFVIYSLLIFLFNPILSMANNNQNLCQRQLETFLELDGQGEFLSSDSYFLLSDFYTDKTVDEISGDSVSRITGYEAHAVSNNQHRYKFEVHFKNKNSTNNKTVMYELELNENNCKIVSPPTERFVFESTKNSNNKNIQTSKNLDERLKFLNNSLQREETRYYRSKQVLEKFIILSMTGHFNNTSGLKDFHQLTGSTLRPLYTNKVNVTDYKINFTSQKDNKINYQVIFKTSDKTADDMTKNYSLTWINTKWIIDIAESEPQDHLVWKIH